MYLFFIGLLVLILITIYFLSYINSYIPLDNFESQDNCFNYGDDYDLCYSKPGCTIGFLSNGSTHCMRKFLYEDI